MADFVTFGREAAGDIIDTVRRVRSMPMGGGGGSEFDAPHVQFRVAKTTTNTDHPTYPSTGDTFVVELGEGSFTETPGDRSITWTAYSPKDTRIAHDVCGNYYTENSYVYVALHHGKWWILGGCTSSSSSSSSSSSTTPSSSSASSVSSISSSSSLSSSSTPSSSSSSSCSGPCNEIEVVTDVACVNGNIVVTKKTLRICGTNVCVEVI